MSQAESKIYSLLTTDASVSALVATRVYPIILPQNCTLPAICYQRISGGQQNNIAGYGNVENPRIQVDVFATTYAAVKDLATKVRTAMDGATTFKALCISDLDLYEDDAAIYRVSLDFSVWNKETS